jgi:hypothetical protein
MGRKKINNLTIVLENCDSFIIPWECIVGMWADNLKEMIHLQSNFGGEKPDEFRYYKAEYVVLFLNNIDKIPLSEFGEDFKKRVNGSPDITQIHIEYEDGSSFYFCVPWEYGDNQTNQYQNNNEIGDNAFMITIIKGDEVEQRS